MSDIPSFPYDILWREKRLVSVANLTRKDAEEFLALAPQRANQSDHGTLSLKPGQHSVGKSEEGESDGCGGIDTRMYKFNVIIYSMKSTWADVLLLLVKMHRVNYGSSSPFKHIYQHCLSRRFPTSLTWRAASLI